MSLLKSNEGYPLTNKQFYDSEWHCAMLLINNKDIDAFKRACYKAIVRYIPVRECLKEKDPAGYTRFFTRHILTENLFILGKEFQIECEALKISSGALPDDLVKLTYQWLEDGHDFEGKETEGRYREVFVSRKELEITHKQQKRK